MLNESEILAGRYELRRLLGSGAMGTVWHGYDREVGQAVAIKRIHPSRLTEIPGSWDPAEAIQRFQREADLLRELNHPGIPAFHDAKLDGNGKDLYIVMELVLGQTLEEVTRERQLSETEIISIAVSLCEILEHAHAIPIIHRDIKPANVMLTSHQRVVILDFGVAAIFKSSHQRLTMAGRTLGTIGFMPPEQLKGREVNPRSDLFALACLLYQLRTGIPPFSDLRYRRPYPVSLLQPGANPYLEAVIMATLAERPADRPASAREFRERLSGGQTVASHVPKQESATAQPRDVRITQAMALFDEGQIGAAFPFFAQLVTELIPPQAEPGVEVECRLRLAQCRSKLGYQSEALEELRALAEELTQLLAPDDRLLLRVLLEIGKLRIALDEDGGLGDLAKVFRLLSATRRSEDELLLLEAREALNRATLGT
ncbi:serine/threonine-protein kinase [Kitasatospora purpeofusca]|uniref:serine/threonine-protein kinase n=1 Tax=Kitasatospora purpeofusca TaxID=67352 RepID=UPI0036C540C8